MDFRVKPAQLVIIEGIQTPSKYTFTTKQLFLKNCNNFVFNLLFFLVRKIHLDLFVKNANVSVMRRHVIQTRVNV